MFPKYVLLSICAFIRVHFGYSGKFHGIHPSGVECPHRCMHDQFCIKFPNHHFCICVMEIMWGIPFHSIHPSGVYTFFQKLVMLSEIFFFKEKLLLWTVSLGKTSENSSLPLFPEIKLPAS